MHAFLSDSLKPHLELNSVTPWRVLMVGLPDTLHEHITELTRQFTWMERPFEIDQAHSIQSAVRLSFDHAYSTVLINQDLIHLSDDDHAIRALREDASRYQSRFILLSDKPSMTPMAEWLLENAIDDHHCYPNVSDNQWLLILGRGCHFFHTKRTRRLLGQGMEQTLAVFDAFLKDESIDYFRESILKQVAAGLGLDAPEMMLFERHSQHDSLLCTYASNRYHPNQGRRLGSIHHDHIQKICSDVLNDKVPMFEGYISAFYQSVGDAECIWVVNEAGCPKDSHQQLIEHVLCCILQFESDVQATQKLKRELNLDTLTGLANEHAFIDALKTPPRLSPLQNIAIINIAQFRTLNAGLGIETADQVLKEFAKRLRNYFGGFCTIARLGGNTFALLGPEDIVVKRRIESILFVPLFINETELPLQYHLSVNAARLPIDNPKQWLIRHEPSKVLIHSNSCEKTAYLRYGDPSELAHYQALTQAFYEGELKLAFQPIIDLLTGRTFGFTSHLVWEEHPQINNTAVLQLLSLGTNERLINDLTDWVIRLSQSALYELKTEHSDVQSMFIPFSLAQTYSSDMPSLIRNLRSETDHSLSDIILQLPVEMTLDNSTKLIEIAHELISSGVDLAMGPLGGALHIHQLSQIPVSYLAVDTVPFKDELAHNDERPSMLNALLAINNALCTTSIAYNISSLEQAHTLAHLGFRFGQGDVLAAPMYLSSLKSWLSNHPYLTF